MDNKAVKTKAPTIKQIAVGASGNLVIPTDFRNKIRYLCSQISTIEWSGVLFYDVTGDIDNVSELTCTLKDIHLMDVGSAAYTEYEVDGSIMELYDTKPELMDCKRGHCHSHNKMGKYFSYFNKN